MQELIKDMLSDSNGGTSSMRVMSFMSLIFGGVIGIVGLFRSCALSELAILTGVFVTSAFGGKALQKISEVKKEKNSDV